MMLCVLGALVWSQAKAQSTYRAAIAGDFADPTILYTRGHYYATGTSSEWAPHFPIYTSDDLKQWKQTGYVFDKAPAWTSGSFWAPEYYQIGDTYYIYYTARRKSDGISCIGVATSSYPDHGFQDQGVLLAYGKEAIDPFIYRDGGQLYITFKAYGLEFRPIELLAYKLSANGLQLQGEPCSLLKDEERIGMEGQSILKKGRYYYLFYSAGGCCEVNCSYNVRVARADRFEGPYQKYEANPLLKGGGGWTCTGHGTFVTTPRQQTLYLHHGYQIADNVFTGRQGLLAKLYWPTGDNAWPVLEEYNSKTGRQANVKYNFNTARPALQWQWDFRHAAPVITQKRGRLILAGTATPGNQTGAAITLRPVSAHFTMSATVVNANAALKGLVFYGDANASAGIGVQDNTVELWTVKGNTRKVWATASVKKGPVMLKFVMHPDKTGSCYYKQAGEAWQEISAGNAPFDISFLPQWDRSPRPGLLFRGNPGETAEFSSFELTNL